MHVRRGPPVLALLLLALAAACSTAPRVSSGPPPVRVAEQVYGEAGGVVLRGDLHVAEGLAVPAPAVLVVHGGSWSRGSRTRMSGIARRLAEAGFVAFSVDYRLAPAHPFPAALEDLRAAVRWMRTQGRRHGIDGDRIGAYGYSAGGHLVALLATTSEAASGAGRAAAGGAASAAVQAAVLGAAPTDLRRLPPSRAVRRFLGGGRDEIPALYDEASPITHVHAAAPPFFIYHGRWDWIVDDSHALRFAAALAERGVPHEYLERPHGHVTTFLFDDEAVIAAIAFLERWLGPAA